jgi:hypothetical protein
MRISRRAVAIAGGPLLLALLGIGVALFTLDLNQFVGPLLARIKTVTGREVTVGGNVSLRIGFTPKVVAATEARLRQHASAPYFLTAKESSCTSRCCRCCGATELVRLNIVAPVVALETNKDGRGNRWSPPGAGVHRPSTRARRICSGRPAGDRWRVAHGDDAGGAATKDDRHAFVEGAGSPIAGGRGASWHGAPVTVTGTVGPFATLSERGTHPVSLGRSGSRKASVALNIRRDKLVALQDVDVAFGSSDSRERSRSAMRVLGVMDREPALDGVQARRPSLSPRRPSPAGGGKSTQYLFSDAPVPFDALQARNADGEIDRTAHPFNRTLDRVHAKFSLRNGKLDAPAVQASAYGGQSSAR